MGLTGVKVVLPPIRFSYLKAISPKINDDGREDYGSQLIVDKDDTKTIRMIEKALQGAFEEGKGLLGIKVDKMPAKLKTTYFDGDEDKNNGNPPDECTQGCMCLNTSSNRKVEVFHGNPPMPLTNPDKIYSGMYGRASVTFKAYVTKDGGKGIACYLNGIQKTKDGARLDGMSSSRSAFDDGFDDLEIDDDYNNDFADEPTKKKVVKKEVDDWDI
jgi:hypothetical protein